jgi:hypothetical protein
VRRIPSQRAGYCYGSRVMYVDKEFMHQLWEEIYDSNLKLWKIVRIHLHPADKTQSKGQTYYSLPGSLIESYWDLQNDHKSDVFTANPNGTTDAVTYNANAPVEYNNITRYSTPGGLMQIMR